MDSTSLANHGDRALGRDAAKANVGWCFEWRVGSAERNSRTAAPKPRAYTRCSRTSGNRERRRSRSAKSAVKTRAPRRIDDGLIRRQVLGAKTIEARSK